MRVVVIDDNQEYLNAISRHFKSEPDMELLAIKNSVGSVTNRVRRFNPDVVLVDLLMPHMSGEELIRLMKREVPRAKYIILSGAEPATLRRVEIEVGAVRSVLKSTDLKHLVQLIRSYERW